MGVTADKIENALYDAFGQRQVSDIYTPTNDYQVLMELLPRYQLDPAALHLLYVRSDAGKLVPLDAVTKPRNTVGPLSVTHLGQLPSVTLSFNLAPGVSLGDAVERIETAARETLPADIRTSFQGVAAAFQSSLQGMGLLLVMAHPGHLHGAGHSVRELHPSDDDSFGTPFGRLRRAGDAADLPRRAQHLLVRRHHHADRHREEERDHDDRLRSRSPAHA